MSFGLWALCMERHRYLGFRFTYSSSSSRLLTIWTFPDSKGNTFSKGNSFCLEKILWIRVKGNNLFCYWEIKTNKLDWMARPWTKFVEVQLGGVFKTNCKFFLGVSVWSSHMACRLILDLFYFPSWKEAFKRQTASCEAISLRVMQLIFLPECHV